MKKKTQESHPQPPAPRAKSGQRGGPPDQDVHHDESRRNAFDPEVAKRMKQKSKP